MFKMNQLVVGLFLFLSSLFSCQQKGDFKTVNVEDFDSIIQDEEVQRLDVRTLAEYSEGHIAKTININVMDDSFASMADSLLQKNKPVALYCRSGIIFPMLITNFPLPIKAYTSPGICFKSISI